MRRAEAAEVKVTCTVSKDTWKELKIYAIRKDFSLAEAAQDIIEKAMSKKSKVAELSEE